MLASFTSFLHLHLPLFCYCHCCCSCCFCHGNRRGTSGAVAYATHGKLDGMVRRASHLKATLRSLLQRFGSSATPRGIHRCCSRSSKGTLQYGLASSVTAVRWRSKCEGNRNVKRQTEMDMFRINTQLHSNSQPSPSFPPSCLDLNSSFNERMDLQ